MGTDLDDDFELLRGRRVHGLGLVHGPGLLVYPEVVSVRIRSAANEGIPDGGVDGVHVDCLDFFWRYVEDAMEDSTGHLKEYRTT